MDSNKVAEENPSGRPCGVGSDARTGRQQTKPTVLGLMARIREGGAAKARVVNIKRDGRYDVYIGRPNSTVPSCKVIEGCAWGNPYKIGVDGDRERVVRLYREMVSQDVELQRRIKEKLRGKVLGCWCKPLKCHGDVLVEFANK